MSSSFIRETVVTCDFGSLHFTSGYLKVQRRKKEGEVATEKKRDVIRQTRPMQ